MFKPIKELTRTELIDRYDRNLRLKIPATTKPAGIECSITIRNPRYDTVGKDIPLKPIVIDTEVNAINRIYKYCLSGYKNDGTPHDFFRYKIYSNVLWVADLFNVLKSTVPDGTEVEMSIWLLEDSAHARFNHHGELSITVYDIDTKADPVKIVLPVSTLVDDTELDIPRPQRFSIWDKNLSTVDKTEVNFQPKYPSRTLTFIAMAVSIFTGENFTVENLKGEI